MICKNDIVVETTHALSLPHALTQHPQSPTNQITGIQRFQNQGKNTVSSIIGSYKAAASKHTHRLGLDLVWQPRFYDHIIRNEASLLQISNYIINNPTLWSEDKFFKNE